MSGSGERSPIPFILVLLLGVGIILYLTIGPQLLHGGFKAILPESVKGWDPITPVINGLTSFTNAIVNLFASFFR